MTAPTFWDPKALLERPVEIPPRIQFLASDDYPPFAFRDGEGKLIGFNVDLARAICRELDTSCSLRIKSFDEMPVALDEEEGDAIIAGLARTKEFADRYAFTEDYMKLPARFVVARSATAGFSEETIADVKLAVQANSRHADFAERFFPEAELLLYPTADEARQAVADGDADAHFGDGLSLSFWLNSPNSRDCCEFAGGPWLDPDYFGDGLSIALRNDDVARREAINYALRRLQQTGTFRELYLRYFPIGFF